MFPRARDEKLLVQEVGDELVVYDQERHRAHRLNATAASIWRHCDGETSVADLAHLLEVNVDSSCPGDVVWLALRQLARAHLLHDPPIEKDLPVISRRVILKNLCVAGILLPVITTLSAPTPLMAQYGVDPQCFLNECAGAYTTFESFFITALSDTVCLRQLEDEILAKGKSFCRARCCVGPRSCDLLGDNGERKWDSNTRSCKAVVTLWECGCR